MHKYEVILRELSTRVAGMEAGARLPTEKKLAAEFDASSMTVRRALQIMIDNGRLRGVPGRGTFVVHPRVTKLLNSASSFTDAMRAAGRTPSSRLLEATIRQADEVEAGWFAVPAGSLVYSITRVRLGDGIPLAYETAVLDARPSPACWGPTWSSRCTTSSSRRTGRADPDRSGGRSAAARSRGGPRAGHRPRRTAPGPPRPPPTEPARPSNAQPGLPGDTTRSRSRRRGGAPHLLGRREPTERRAVERAERDLGGRLVPSPSVVRSRSPTR